MKKLISMSLVTALVLGMGLGGGASNDLFSAESSLAAEPDKDVEKKVTKPVFEDGKAQPILEYTDLRASDYTNEGSDILRYCVYVETDHDTDADGKADLVEALIQVPRAAAEGDFKAATIYDPTPYGAGVVVENWSETRKPYNPVPFDYKKLYEPGKKRTPKGSMTTLEAAQAAHPESWNYIVPVSGDIGYDIADRYDYYLVRGFAVVEAGGIGTYGSEGFELCGFDLERDCHKCVVEWLTGKRKAYTNPFDDIEISADWSNGNVAMTGCSYGGTIPFEVATTGVEGLKTIIPIAGIASWYDYTNSQGVPRFTSAAYADLLASFNSGAAYLDDDWTVINDDYASFLWQLSQDQDATNGDYADIWKSLDYSLDSSAINCTALIVQGLNDFNVCTKQADLMARSFEKAGKDYKLVLHQDGHSILDGTIFGDHLWQEIMNKWLSHYLYDVDNDIENMPKVSVQSNVDGSFKTYDSWADFEYEEFDYDKTVNPDKVSSIDTTAIGKDYLKYAEGTDEFGRPLLRDNYYLSMPERTKSTYVFELPDNYTFTGVPEVHLKMSTKDVDKDGMVISALLMDTIDDETSFKAYMTKERLGDTLPRHTLALMESGGGLPYIKVQEFVKSNTTAKLITFGHTDLKNYGGGYEGRDYTKIEEEMKAGEYYDYTIYLQPTSYTFEPGHKAVLVVTGWDPYCAFLDEDVLNGTIADSTESEYIYSFNIDNSAFELRFPKIKDSSSKSDKTADEKDRTGNVSDKEEKSDESDKDAKKDDSAKNEKAEGAISFSFATKKEGTDLMLANKEYYKEFNSNKIDYIMQKKNATKDEYLEFATKQVLEWTDEEKDLITRAMEEIEDTFKGRGWKMPPLDNIVFIRTTMEEEGGSLAYTHGTQIYIGDLEKEYGKEIFADEFVPDDVRTAIAQELFHCLTRKNPDFRKEMYDIIGFTVADKDYKLPASLQDYYIVNPDVEHHDSYATFTIDGKKTDCYTVFITSKHFEKKGDSFFNDGVTALVPVDNPDKYFTSDDASDFYKVFGKNTDFVIDPEECLAENFSFAVAYGQAGPEGKGYENPEIIDKIYKVLAK